MYGVKYVNSDFSSIKDKAMTEVFDLISKEWKGGTLNY